MSCLLICKARKTQVLQAWDIRAYDFIALKLLRKVQLERWNG